MHPKVNEVWRTRSGNLALIVANPESVDVDDKIRMLWYDKVDKEWTVTSVLNRLEYKSDLSFADMVHAVM